MPEDLTYKNAVANIEKVLIKGRRTKADVFITQSGGSRFLVKDYTQKGFWERTLAGRTVIGRETRAYDALSGIDGFPDHYKRLSPFSIAVEYLDGKDLGEVARGEIGPDVIRQLERIVHELHAHGWVHLDLHRRANILLISGRVYVVDLASALHTGFIPLAGQVLTFLFGLADRLSLIKMKTIFAPELMTPREKKWLALRNTFMPTKWDVT